VNIRERSGVMSQTIALVTAGVSRAAALSHAHTTSANNAHKRTYWPATSKSAFYANFYAADEATGALFG
jgi:hypothetical protein